MNSNYRNSKLKKYREEQIANVNRITLGTFKTTHKMRRYIEQVLSTGRLSYSVMCGEFEARFALLHDSLHGVLSNSGTSSLQVAIQALKIMNGWQDGDEIIIPATTFVATANAVIHNNMIPVLVDIEPEYWCIDTELIEQKITKKTKAIIPVHLFGHPANMKKICAIADAHNLKVIEDSCESMFVSAFEKSVGSWGDVGVFSFYVAHILTMGVGGIGITRNEELALLMRSLVNHGITTTELPAGSLYDPTHLGRRFTFDHVGHSFRITELEAAIGLAQLDEWYNIMDARQKNARILDTGLLALTPHLQTQMVHKECEHAYMVYPFAVKNQPKNILRNHLENAGIECREAMPLTTQPCYVNFYPEDYPVSNFLNNHGLYVGCHQDLSESSIYYMLEEFSDFFN